MIFARALALALVVGCVSGQMGMGSGRRMRDKEPVPVKADIKHIKWYAPNDSSGKSLPPRPQSVTCRDVLCGSDVCQMAMQNIYRGTEAARAEAKVLTTMTKPGKRATKSTFSESEVSEVRWSPCPTARPTQWTGIVFSSEIATAAYLKVVLYFFFFGNSI